jgi:hypothetical protein
VKIGALSGHFIFPRGVGGVRVVQGTVRALFYTKFTRKKDTLLSYYLNPPLTKQKMSKQKIKQKIKQKVKQNKNIVCRLETWKVQVANI